MTRRSTAPWKPGSGLALDRYVIFDREVALDAGVIAPIVTWDDAGRRAADRRERTRSGARADPVRAKYLRDALDYMGITPGKSLPALRSIRIHWLRTERPHQDLRAAAAVLLGCRARCRESSPPGSSSVKRQAEEEVSTGISAMPVSNGRTSDARCASASTATWCRPATLRLDHQPQFPRPAGPGRALRFNVPGHGRRRRVTDIPLTCGSCLPTASQS